MSGLTSKILPAVFIIVGIWLAYRGWKAVK